MSRYIKVDGHSGFVRDKHTNAILNINTKEIESAIARKVERRKEKEELKTLKEDVSEIKVLLKKLLEDNHGKHPSKFS